MFPSSTRIRLAALFALVLGTVVLAAVKFGPSAKAEPEPAAMMDTQALGAVTKTVGPAGNANPGDILTYTVTIPNGAGTVNNVIFSDTIDANTTLVPNSVTVTPIALDDTYTATGNVQIDVPAANGLLANDTNPVAGAATNAGLTISALAGDATAPFSGNSTHGQVTSSATDGSFSYNPNPGYTGPDSFTYTVTGQGGATSTATVNITVSGMIWFVNASAGAGGDGRFTSPYNCLVGAGCFSTATSAANDNIFVYTGSYADTAALTLLSGQKLIGQGASTALTGVGSITGITPAPFSQTLPSTGGTNPTITSTANAINLGSGNTVRGVTIDNVPAANSKISGTNFGTLILGNTTPDMTLSGTGKALDLTTGAFDVTSALTSVSSTSSTTQAVNLTGVTGTVSLGTGSLSGAAGNTFNVSGGTLSATYSGSISQANNAALVSIAGGHNTGTITFSTGTLSASNGTGLQFNNADGTYNFNGTNTLNGGDAGIDIINGSAGTFSFSANSAITSPTASRSTRIRAARTSHTTARSRRPSTLPLLSLRPAILAVPSTSTGWLRRAPRRRPL